MEGVSPLSDLIKTSNCNFLSDSRLGFWERCIYSCTIFVTTLSFLIYIGKVSCLTTVRSDTCNIKTNNYMSLKKKKKEKNICQTCTVIIYETHSIYMFVKICVLNLCTWFCRYPNSKKHQTPTLLEKPCGESSGTWTMAQQFKYKNSIKSLY